MSQFVLTILFGLMAIITPSHTCSGGNGGVSDLKRELDYGMYYRCIIGIPQILLIPGHILRKQAWTRSDIQTASYDIFSWLSSD